MPNPIEPPDIHHVVAAQGWLELGNLTEATAELRQLSPKVQRHPGVLELRRRIARAAEDWQGCLELSQTLTQTAPELALSWVLLAQSYYHLKCYQEAYDTLRPKAELFPQDYEVAYDLACYCSLLGRMDEAMSWLRKAMQAGEPDKIKRMAQEDPDFKPLWEQLGRRGL